MSDKRYRKNQNAHILINNFFFNRAVYEIMWKNIVERSRPEMPIWGMRIVCWITKAKHTHSEYVILIVSHYNNGCTNARASM